MSAPRAGFLALLGGRGGCGTGRGPQTVLALFRAQPALLSASGKGKHLRTEVSGEPGKRVEKPGVKSTALRRRGNGRLAGAVGWRSSEPQASLASRPACRVAQGTRAAGVDSAVAFFGYSWRSKRKYARRQGGTQRFKNLYPSQFQLKTP